ncbi:MAG: signal peptidase I [Anaerolineae bacterium]|nr:signal peptidase I [Anaerolineae bacterium]
MVVFGCFICITALTLGLLFLRFSLLIVNVDGMSMSPFLNDKDRVIIFKYGNILVNHGKPPKVKRGDIVVCKKPSSPKYWNEVINEFDIMTVRSLKTNGQVNFIPKNHSYVIKRVIGLPGESVQIPYSEVLLPFFPSNIPIKTENNSYVWNIPADCCFLRSDALQSSDSRIWGPIPLKDLLGVMILRLPRT